MTRPDHVDLGDVPASGEATPRQGPGTVPGHSVDPQTSAEPDRANAGRTSIAQQAVERIAAQVVAECREAGGVARRLLGVTVGEAQQRGADVTARMHGTTAVSVAVRCSVPYPRPIGRATDTLRRLLVDRIGELTGLTVQRVDITITELTFGPRTRRVE